MFRTTYRQLNITVPEKLLSLADCQIFQADNALARAYFYGSTAMAKYLDNIDLPDLAILFYELMQSETIDTAINVIRARAHEAQKTL